MTFQGALIEEQGVTFAIVIVKLSVLSNETEANHLIVSFRPIFPGVPIVLTAHDSRGVPTYYGRPDLVKFLANVPIAAISWKEFTIS